MYALHFDFDVLFFLEGGRPGGVVVNPRIYCYTALVLEFDSHRGEVGLYLQKK